MKTKNVNTLIISIFFTILFFGLMSTTVVHAQVSNYLPATNWTLSADAGRTPSPTCIAVDSANNVYVADYNNELIEKFTSNGTLITEWAFQNLTYGKVGQRGIAVDSSGNVYVIEENNPVIKKFTQNSFNNYSLNTTWTLVSDTGRTPYPTCIAVDSSNNVYVADYNNDIFQKFASNGTSITKWAFQDLTAGKVCQNGIAVDSFDNVYVIEENKPVIKKFTPNSPISYSLATNWTLSSDSGKTPYPTCIAIDSLNNVYVADYGNELIEKFTSNGTPITKWAFQNNTYNGLGQNGIAVDSSGSVYVIDGMDPIINKFTKRTFLPNPNGYHFDNFGSEQLPWDAFKQTFGAANVENSDIAKRIYDKHYSKIGRGGNCFGMSTSSLLLYSSYNEPQAWSLTIDEKPGLDIIRPYSSSSVRDWIRYYQGKQISYDVSEEKEKYTSANQVFNTLDSRMSNENYWEDPMVIGYSWWNEPYTDLNNNGVYDLTEPYIHRKTLNWWNFSYEDNGKIDYSGHAVVPYKIEKFSDYGKVFVYDSRYNGTKDLYFRFDFKKDTVSPLMNDITNEVVKNSGYDNYFRINAYPMKLCSLSTIKKSPTRLPSEDYLDKYGTLLYTDASGNNLGYINGEFKSDIPGAYYVEMYGSDNITFPETYLLPDTDLKRHVCGLQDGIANVTIFRPNAMVLAEIPVSLGSIDELYTPSDASYVEFKSGQGTSSLGLMLEKEGSGVAQIVYANISQIETNGGVDLSMVNSSVVMKNTGLPRTCTFKLEQALKNPNSANIDMSIIVEKDSTILIEPKNWNDISNSLITIKHDVGSDGTIDSVQTIDPNSVLPLPVANFTTNVTNGYAPLTVKFTDLSKNTTSWKWDFGDATYSTEQNPVHTYTEEGNYTVLLNSSNSAGYDVEQRIISVVNDSAPELELIGNKSVSVNELLSFNVSATDADGDAILYSATGLPIGAIFDAITGSFSWIPGTGTAGTYDITFNATANGITDSESIRITVLSNEVHEDQPPVLALIGNKSVRVNELLSFPISAKDADGDAIAYSSVDLPSGATLDATTGVFNWTPDTAGAYDVTFTATANGKSDSETIKITVSQLVTEDHAPELALIGNKSVSVNDLLIFAVSAMDADGDIISYSATGLPTGAVFDTTTATFSWTPSITDVGTYYVTFSAAANGKTDSEIIKITVLSNEVHEDQPPVLAAIGAKSVNTKSLVCFTISANDPDGDIVKYSANGLPCGAKLDATTGKFTWTPTAAGTYTVKFIANANGKSDYETIKITVKSTNKPPVLACIGSKTVEKGKQLSFTISARDPDGDKVKYSATGLPKGAKLDVTTGKFTWTSTTTGTYTVKFIATANGQSDYETVKITVKNANKPPVLACIGSKTVKEGKQLCFTISAKDPDGDKVKYSATGLPKGAKFDATTCKFTWTPGYNAAGTYSVKFTATANGQSDSETVKITVKNVK